MPRLSKIGAAALAAFGWSSGTSGVTASYLVVAGGGGGGSPEAAGGGGAGGFLTGTSTLNPTLSYTVTVGAGGVGGRTTPTDSTNGANSVFNAITSIGGGRGGNANFTQTGGNGGSGGGGAYSGGAAGGTGTVGQGNNGGSGATDSGDDNKLAGGGGGGASAVGGNGTKPSSGLGGNGGAGTSSSISGSSVTYAGGGGGGKYGTGTAGSGGAGGGGAGTVAGTANTGGGGGGGNGVPAVSGGNGGSGIVIISYAGAQQFGGGVVTSVGGNTIHTFTTSGTLSPITSLSASYLVVAGGGAGGGAQDTAGGGGGGAGGLRSGSGLTIDTTSTYLVTVGGGGTGGLQANGTKGSDSAFLSITSTGGGYGAVEGSTPPNFYGVGGDGGSGGGGSRGGAAGSGNTPSTSPSQGNNAGTSTIFGAAGGGGSSAVGGNGASTTGGTGGAGTASSISGSSVTYAGGGGGGVYTTGTPGSGGAGGGGAGGAANGSNGFAGTANLGGGGGGASGGGSTQRSGGNGGSGVVIISYPGSTAQMSGGTVTIVGGNTIHTFTSSGYLSPIVLLNRSLRFRSSASAYLNRTPASAGNRQTWTWSSWVKRGALGSEQAIFSAGTGGNRTYLYFDSGDSLRFDGNGNIFRVSTNVFRDPSAWYHIMWVLDTNNSTAQNRTRIYINGLEITSWSTNTTISSGASYDINTAALHVIGRNSEFSNRYIDGYLTEVNFIDGQALTPSSFGSFNAYGSWSPVRYGGSYGTNGFYLPFTNNASTTTLGYDFSPNGNNWTTNNISLTAGSTYDSMTDVPTLTSATAANYCTFNPLYIVQGNSNANSTWSDGNLKFTNGSTANVTSMPTMALPTSGKWYWEITVPTFGSGSNPIVGICDFTGLASGLGGWWYRSDGNKYDQSATGFAYGASWTAGTVIGVAVDMGAATLTFYKNGVSQGVAWTSITTGVSGTLLYPFVRVNATGDVYTANFGQQPFVYTPPSGFVALNTYNL